MGVTSLPTTASAAAAAHLALRRHSVVAGSAGQQPPGTAAGPPWRRQPSSADCSSTGQQQCTAPASAQQLLWPLPAQHAEAAMAGATPHYCWPPDTRPGLACQPSWPHPHTPLPGPGASHQPKLLTSLQDFSDRNMATLIRRLELYRRPGESGRKIRSSGGEVVLFCRGGTHGTPGNTGDTMIAGNTMEHQGAQLTPGNTGDTMER